MRAASSAFPKNAPRRLFFTALFNRPMLVAGVAMLSAMNIDSEQAARDYRERTVGPHIRLDFGIYELSREGCDG